MVWKRHIDQLKHRSSSPIPPIEVSIEDSNPISNSQLEDGSSTTPEMVAPEISETITPEIPEPATPMAVSEDTALMPTSRRFTRLRRAPKRLDLYKGEQCSVCV